METGTVTIPKCTAIKATEKALLIKFDDGIERWCPRSQIRPGSQVAGLHTSGDFIVSRWWADSAGAAPGPREPTAASPTRHPQGKPLENKPGLGCMFPQRAEGKRPTWRGGVNIGGQEYELVGWTRQSKSGRDYLSLAIETRAALEPHIPAQPAPEAAPMDEDIPF